MSKCTQAGISIAIRVACLAFAVCLSGVGLAARADKPPHDILILARDNKSGSELYNLSEDLFEQRDRIQVEGERAEQMKSQLKEFVQGVSK